MIDSFTCIHVSAEFPPYKVHMQKIESETNVKTVKSILCVSLSTIGFSIRVVSRVLKLTSSIFKHNLLKIKL